MRKYYWLWNKTPLHCGVGDAEDRNQLLFKLKVDEKNSCPVIPATSLRGILRDALKNHPMFGDLPGKSQNIEEERTCGRLSIGHAWPIIVPCALGKWGFSSKFLASFEGIKKEDIFKKISFLNEKNLIDLDIGIKITNENHQVIFKKDFIKHIQDILELRPHIRVDLKTKVVKNGALWHDELFPSDSLWLFTIDLREESLEKDFLEKMKNLEIQVGAQATTGLGYCKIGEVI